METAAPVLVAHRRKRRIWLPFLVALLLAAVAGNVLLALKYHAAVHSNPVSQQQQLLDAVAQDVVVPRGTPVVSTVADKRKLTNPALAGVVNNGDKILIYANAKRLIVYRPSVRKVVTILTIQN